MRANARHVFREVNNPRLPRIRRVAVPFSPSLSSSPAERLPLSVRSLRLFRFPSFLFLARSLSIRTHRTHSRTHVYMSIASPFTASLSALARSCLFLRGLVDQSENGDASHSWSFIGARVPDLRVTEYVPSRTRRDIILSRSRGDECNDTDREACNIRS